MRRGWDCGWGCVAFEVALSFSDCSGGETLASWAGGAAGGAAGGWELSVLEMVMTELEATSGGDMVL
jgi:hypothetical protein